MSADKKHILDKLSYRPLNLYSDYRIVNSNYIFGQGKIPYIGHTPYCRQLESLLANSDGGAILVTGFRGVGKSTMVNNAIYNLNQQGLCRLIPIPVVLPAEKQYGQVLVEVIRKLYETLSHGLLWSELNDEMQERIRLAYNRTLLNIKHSRNTTTEGELSVQFPAGWSPTAKAKGSRQQAEEGNYLVFSEEDAEYELIQCIESLYESDTRNKIVIIIDEIDKMTIKPEGMICFDNLLERMKNLISSANALFIFVAGIDIYKRWESNRQKINSLYDSLFEYHIYLPCIWDSAEDLFEVIEDKKYVFKPVNQAFSELVQTGYTTILEESFRMIENYILFKGKGLPRKILGTFNDFVIWDGEQPSFMLTENRIQAILLVGRLLKKFHIFASSVKMTTIYERDIYNTLFFFMLEYLLFLENTSFTKEQIKKAILDERSSMREYFEEILNKLLEEFEKLSFVRKTDTGYVVIDDTILKKDQSLQILDQDLLLHNQGEEQLPDRKDTSVDERFHAQINLAHNAGLTAFWNDYKVGRVITDSKQMMIFNVISYHSGLQQYAVVYKKNNRAEAESEDSTISNNLYAAGTYQFKGPYFLDTVDFIEHGMPVSSLRTAVDGYALMHLIEAKLENQTIYQIVRQVIFLIDYLHREGFGNVRLNPDNIMVCKDAAIKILDLKHICRLGSRKISGASCIYSAPEVYLWGCSAAADYYSAGILLAEMIVGRKLSRYYTERNIDVKTVLMKETCSQGLKDVLVKATSFDPENRYAQGSAFMAALEKCPEFRGMKRLPLPKSKNGVVIGRNITAAVPIESSDAKSPIALEFGVQQFIDKKHKLIERDYTANLDGAYFGDEITFMSNDNRKDAYLVRQNNNERIALNKLVFHIGREKESVDYSIENAHISRQHVVFFQNNDNFYVKDLGSTNGTYLNSERIVPQKVYKLAHGDQIQIANEEFVFNEQ